MFPNGEIEGYLVTPTPGQHGTLVSPGWLRLPWGPVCQLWYCCHQTTISSLALVSQGKWFLHQSSQSHEYIHHLRSLFNSISSMDENICGGLS